MSHWYLLPVCYIVSYPIADNINLASFVINSLQNQSQNKQFTGCLGFYLVIKFIRLLISRKIWLLALLLNNQREKQTHNVHILGFIITHTNTAVDVTFCLLKCSSSHKSCFSCPHGYATYDKSLVCKIHKMFR